jgi:hypothetical protein
MTAVRAPADGGLSPWPEAQHLYRNQNGRRAIQTPRRLAAGIAEEKAAMTKELTTITTGEEHIHARVLIDDAGIGDDVADVGKWLAEHHEIKWLVEYDSKERALLARVLAYWGDPDDADAGLAKAGLVIVHYAEHGHEGFDFITYADAEDAKAAGVETFSTVEVRQQLKAWAEELYGTEAERFGTQTA